MRFPNREIQQVEANYAAFSFDIALGGIAVEDADRFVIDRARPKRHLSFGFGIHRCAGERLAEMQLRIVWEEILARFGRIEVLEEPSRVFSVLVHGYGRMMVRIDPVNVVNKH